MSFAFFEIVEEGRTERAGGVDVMPLHLLKASCTLSESLSRGICKLFSGDSVGKFSAGCGSAAALRECLTSFFIPTPKAERKIL